MKNIQIFILAILFFISHNSSAQYKIMVSTDYPPYNFFDEKGNLTGFNIDILNAIKEIYKNEIVIKGASWDSVKICLENGNAQAIAGAHYPGAPDPNNMYTRSVIQTTHSFIYNKKHVKHITTEHIRTIHQPVIVLWKNEVLINYIRTINPNAVLIFIRTYEELFDALERTDITCAFSQKIASMYFARKLGRQGIRTSFEEPLALNMGFKIAKDSPELAKMLNNGLEVIMSNGEYKRIHKKWIEDYDIQVINQKKYIRYFSAAGIFIALIIVLLIIFNHILHFRVHKRTEDLQQQLKLNTLITRELKQQKIKAEESERMKTAFLANMSHEIRTPMNGILGFTDLLKSHDYSQDEQKHFIQVIKQNGERMLETINNIIEISKMESGVETAHIQKIDTENIIKELFAFFEPEAKNKGIKLIIEKNQNNSIPSFYTDRYKLNSILTNLIKNALKFTQEGSVKIGYSISEKMARFYISDTGIGIEREDHSAIFKSFLQADISHSRNFEGSGLGLAISSQFVSVLKGKIWLESEPGKGSTFFIDIPNHSSTTELAQEQNNYSPESTLPENLKILIAEDDEVSYAYLKYILDSISDNILHAENGIDTVELLKENPDIELILLNTKMPRQDGLEAARQIRKFNKDVLIIAQTTTSENGITKEALNAGCDDYIEKPINKAELFDKIASSRIVDIFAGTQFDSSLIM